MLREAELKVLLARPLKGRVFVALRDRVIILDLADCGVRLSELSPLRVASPAERELRHGRHPRSGQGTSCPRRVPFNPATGEVLRRCLRARARPHGRRTTAAWLGRYGELNE
ncbi:predicted protein [Streptomyces sp. AA4]|nr:predicted protein [Streptomyces sp. AA4]